MHVKDPKAAEKRCSGKNNVQKFYQSLNLCSKAGALSALSQSAFPGESKPNFPLEDPTWDNKEFKIRQQTAVLSEVR